MSLDFSVKPVSGRTMAMVTRDQTNVAVTGIATFFTFLLYLIFEHSQNTAVQRRKTQNYPRAEADED